MMTVYREKITCAVLAACLLVISLTAGCGRSTDATYPIDDTVVTTAVRTIDFTPYPIAPGLEPTQLPQISDYGLYGYGDWEFGPPLAPEQRGDIMPPGYAYPAGPVKAQLSNFFVFTDIHCTDKESPAQLIYLQQLDENDAACTSCYSPVMLYTTHVLDAAVQTINALHKQKPYDFGISLGDAADKTQYNELRWYIDVIDGKIITPSSGAHLGACTIDYQKPYMAAGLDQTIPWYQALGNHDHFWIGSVSVLQTWLRDAFVGNTVIAAGDILTNPYNFNSPDFYMGVLDGSTRYGDIKGAGPVQDFSSPPRVAADPDRYSLSRGEWINEFFNTASEPAGHGFNLVDPAEEPNFACYSFLPDANVPLKVIVLDDTQTEADGSQDIHGHGFLDQVRWTWLKNELDAGDAAGQLMIIATHIPIGVEPLFSELEWWVNPQTLPPFAQNAATLAELLTELQSHPNLLVWLAGHRHFNTVKAFPSADPAHPENGFWQVETSSLRDFPQQFRNITINLNSDYTISIDAINVDPAVKEGTPAAVSRRYAVAAQQIVGTPGIYQNNAVQIDYTTQMETTDPDTSIHPMPTGSYNGKLYKQLSPDMIAKLQALFP